MSSKAIYEIDAELRDVQGKGASRRLRRTESKVPGILYGGGEDPTLISLNHLKVLHALEHDTFYSHILTIKLEGKKQQAVLKDVQRHPFKKAIAHMDFMRVKPTDYITMRIPIHFKGGEEAPGVKDSAGVITHHMSDLEIRCQVKDLPESIELDISMMKLDDSFHLSDLKLPKGSQSVALMHGKEHDHPVISIHLPRALVEEETAPVVTEEEGEGEAATPNAAAGAKGGADKGKGGADKGKAGADKAKPAAAKGATDKAAADKGKNDKGKGKGK